VLVAVVALAAGAGSTLGQQATFAGKVIRRITVEGLVRTPEAEVLGRMRIRLGERFDPEVVEQEAGRLFALGKFERVLGPYVSEFEDGVAVRFVVAEKPLVLRLQFRGRESISESDLVTGTPSLRTKEGDLYNSYLARQDEDTIRNKYLDEGYLFVAVDHVAETTSRGVIVTFVIAEGTRVRIREIKFLGNRSVPDGDLLDVMSTREKGFGLLQLFWPGFFNYRTLEADAVAIKRYYRRLGFLDAQAEPEDVQLDPDQERMIITIRVDEGPRFTFRGYQLSGNSVFSDQTLRDLTTAPVGSPYDETRMESDRQAILDYYKDRAYIFAEVERRFVFSETGADVFVAFDIEENNEIHINEVRVRGNLKTKDEVVRRELDFHPGERIDNSKLVKSRSNLARLQIFRDIQYTYEATGQPSSRNVVVNVDEAGRGQMIFGVGVTSHFGVVGNLEITLRNFDLFDWPQSFYDIPEAWTGAGQTLRLVVRPGTRFSRYVLTFIEPYLFDTRNELALSFQSVDVLREDWEEGRTSFQPTVTHRFDFDRDLSIAFGARLSEIEVSDIESDAPDDVFESEGHTTVIGLNVGMEYDKRLIEPFEGAYDGHEEGASYHYYGDFLGGDVDYHSFHLHQDLFFPLYTVRDWNAHHVITFRARYGWMRPFDESDTIPIFERFFLGGPQDVRGFRFRGVGPHENGEPVGGTSELWGTLEYSFPIFQKLLRGVAFLDYGNLDELSNFRLETMRVAAGGGLRINFPFFGGYPLPIGLYFGHPIREEPEDESRLFLFSIGDAF
jgi:outer membrane protein insertion porin family